MFGGRAVAADSELAKPTTNESGKRTARRDFIGKSATADTSSGMPEAFLGQAHLPWVTWDDASRKGVAADSHPASAELGPPENGIALRQAVGGGFGAARLRLSDAAEATPSDSLNSQSSTLNSPRPLLQRLHHQVLESVLDFEDIARGALDHEDQDQLLLGIDPEVGVVGTAPAVAAGRAQ